MNAYRRIGFKPRIRYHFTEVATEIEATIGLVVKKIISDVEKHGGSAAYLSELHLLTINRSLTL